ncbi:MAG TPA: hypothetical protein VGM78_08210, partial [Ilumatobacteraceae bacterium]
GTFETSQCVRVDVHRPAPTGLFSVPITIVPLILTTAFDLACAADYAAVISIITTIAAEPTP